MFRSNVSQDQWLAVLMLCAACNLDVAMTQKQCHLGLGAILNALVNSGFVRWYENIRMERPTPQYNWRYSWLHSSGGFRFHVLSRRAALPPKLLANWGILGRPYAVGPALTVWYFSWRSWAFILEILRNFGEIPKKFRWNLAKFERNLVKFANLGKVVAIFLK